MKSILIIDHGSRLDAANDMLQCVARLVQSLAGGDVVVEYAHMELAEPSIAAGFARCVERGATEVIAFPYMLSPGKHSTRDIPNLVAEAAVAHPHVRFAVTPAFGVHEKLAELILMRAGVAAVAAAAPAATAPGADHCWAPAGCEGQCGAACRARPQSIAGEVAAALPVPGLPSRAAH